METSFGAHLHGRFLCMDQNARTEAAINDLELEAVRETLSKCLPGEIISTRDVDSYVHQQPTNLQEDTLVTT
jgi:hypothetical protein